MAVSNTFNSIRKSLVGSTDSIDEKVVNSLKSPNDAIVLLIHTWALENDLNLIQVGEGDVKNSGESSNALDQYEWNSNGPNHYSFKYQDSKTSKTLEIEVSRRLSAEVQVNAEIATSQEDASTRLRVGDYVTTSFFKSGTQEFGDISDVFVSGEKISELWSILDITILEKLGLRENSTKSREAHPKLRDTRTSRILRESTDRSAADSSPSPASHGPGTPFGTPPSSLPQHSHRYLPRGGDFPIGFEDEYEINGKLRLPGSSNSGSSQSGSGASQPPFLPIGDRDLNPPGFGPTSSTRPFGSGSGGGMNPTMEEIMRQGREGHGNLRSEDPDDLLMRPPGARWDPTGPGQGGRGSRGGFGGGFGNSFGSGFGGDFI